MAGPLSGPGQSCDLEALPLPAGTTRSSSTVVSPALRVNPELESAIKVKREKRLSI